MSLLLISCDSGDGNKKNLEDSVAQGEDTGHPHFPSEYADKWDPEGCKDEDGDYHTAAYILGEGSTDEDGTLTLTETWYWAFDDAGYEDDCVDELNYVGDPVTQSILTQLNASEAEEGYWGTLSSTGDGCPSVNYLGMWEHSDEKKYEYGDKWSTDFIVVFDTLTPSGNVNWENAMLVFMYILDDGAVISGSTDYARGVFEPDTDVLGPPAHYTWETSICFSG